MRRVLIAALLWCMAHTAAFAQAYPAHAIRLIVPFPPGGGFDAIGRPFAEKLGSLLGQPVILDNRPGAAGNVGADVALGSPADGYTLLLSNDFLAINPATLKSTRYDPLKDFAPISRIGTVPMALAVHPGLAASNLKEFIALSKARPLNIGTPGVGSTPHLVIEMLNLDGVWRVAHVPYKGSNPAITDVISGQIDAILTTLSSLAPHIRAGRLRGIAVLSGKRSSVLPDLPTFAEGGVAAIDADLWYALFAPAGTPEPVLRRLREATVQALVQPDLVERLRGAGYEPGSSTPEALAALLKTDLEKWRRVVRDAKIQAE
jgi:tripartite-type tricarboxylate transporter receptor subunit TctC